MAFGWWRSTELQRRSRDGRRIELSSNERELMAVEKSVRLGIGIGWVTRGADVLVRTDNTTTYFNINRRASCLSLRPAMRRLLGLTEALDVRLRAEHVPGVENVIADSLSRLSPSGDYGLRPGVLASVLQRLETGIEVDWFANSSNKQHPLYCSLSKDRHALAQDALMQTWSSRRGLVHPPLPLLVRCLVKIKQERAAAVIIVPDWQGMLWSSTLQAMTVRSVTVGNAEDVLQMGPKMRRNGAKLPPGRLVAVLVQG